MKKKEKMVKKLPNLYKIYLILIKNNNDKFRQISSEYKGILLL